LGIIAVAAGLLACAASPTAIAAVQATYYVSAVGSGSTCSAAAPCSLSTAKSNLEAAEPTMTGDLIVQLAGGTYSLTSTINLSAGDSGTGGHSVIYQAAPGQTAIFSGGQVITGWTLHDSTANIWEAAVSVGFTTRQIYVNGVVAQLAEQNASVLGTYTQTTSGYTLSTSTLAGWSRPTDVDFVYPGGGATLASHGTWTDSLCAVASVSGTTVTMQTPCFSNASNGSNGPGVNIPTYIENNYALLSQPGQFYIDSGAGIIYYIPRSGENLSTASVVAATLQTLLSVNGTPANPVHNLQITGLTFEYATWLPPANNGQVPLQANSLESGSGSTPTLTMMPSAVQFHTAQNVSFSGNTLVHLGGGALSFDGGGQNNSVIGNVITDVAGNGISIGAGPWPTTSPYTPLENGYVVNDNYVYNVANRYLGGVGIFAGFVESTTIDHNEVWNIPYSGISLGWGWGTESTTGMTDNHVDSNYVHDVMTSSLYDGGGIYVNGTESTATAAPTIKNNYITGDSQAYGEIYLDNASSYWLVENNVAAHAPSTNWLFINAGNNNTADSNYSDNTAMAATGSMNTISGNSTGLTSWPSAAQAIMSNAGLEGTYTSLLNGPEQSNLAFGATATASSTYGTAFSPDKAVDSNTSTGWSPTGTDPAPFWQVDLGAAYSLSDIQLLTRQDLDQPGSRQNFAIQVSNSATFATYTVACTQGSVALPFRASFDCAPPGGSWRYVRIAAATGGYLFLTEVRVYGAVDSNVALGGVAYASSTYSSSFTPADAIDGSIADGWSPTGADTAPWWEVDLGRQYTLSQLQLVTRQDIDWATTRQNFQIWVSNNLDMSLGATVACTYTTPALPYQSTYTCKLPPGPYRYVAAIKSDHLYFFISELRVFGH
jgi:hypothetical protein